MMEQVAAERLAAIDLFSDLSAAELDTVAKLTRHVQAPTGSVVAEENDISSKFFVILDGTVTVHRSGHHVTDLGPGDFFGEAGALNFAARNASVIATTPLELGVIMAWDLRDVLEDVPSFADRLKAADMERRRQSGS